MPPTLERILRWITICGLFSIPFIVLINDSTMYQPFVSAKGFVFRIIVELIAGAWLVLASAHIKYRPKQSWILASLSVFVVIMAIANVQGVNPSKSLWGNYERMEGWVTLIHVFIYILIASSVLSTEKLWRRMFQTSLAVSGIVAIYGLLQLAGVKAFVDMWQAGSALRIDSTMGSPNYLSVYMFFHVFISAFLFVQTWAKVPRHKLLPQLIVYGGIFFLDAIILVFAGSRGGILGLLFGSLLSLVLFFFLRISKEKRMVVVILILTIIISIGALRLAKDTSLIRNIEPLNRIASISGDDNSLQTRLLLYSIAWQGVKERPILGWGQENYMFVFYKHFDPRLGPEYLRGDRAHNIVFEQLIAAGFAGLIAYLSIIATALWVTWKRGRFSTAERCIFTGLLSGYFVLNLFLFDTVVSYSLFGIILAYLIYKEAGDRPIFSKYIVAESSLPYITAIALIVSLIVIWSVNLNAISVSKLLAQALTQQPEGLQKNLEYFKQAISLNSLGTAEARIELARVAISISQDKSVSDDIRQEFLKYTTQQLELQVKESPYDGPILGEVYYYYNDYENSKRAFQNALQFSPTNKYIVAALARTEEIGPK